MAEFRIDYNGAYKACVEELRKRGKSLLAGPSRTRDKVASTASTDLLLAVNFACWAERFPDARRWALVAYGGALWRVRERRGEYASWPVPKRDTEYPSARSADTARACRMAVLMGALAARAGPPPADVEALKEAARFSAERADWYVRFFSQPSDGIDPSEPFAQYQWIQETFLNAVWPAWVVGDKGAQRVAQSTLDFLEGVARRVRKPKSPHPVGIKALPSFVALHRACMMGDGDGFVRAIPALFTASGANGGSAEEYLLWLTALAMVVEKETGSSIEHGVGKGAWNGITPSQYWGED